MIIGSPRRSGGPGAARDPEDSSTAETPDGTPDRGPGRVAAARSAGARGGSGRVGNGSALAGDGSTQAGDGSARDGDGVRRARGGSRRPVVVGADRAALEQERDFLLASLRDLEAEHAAGDIDEQDYHSLRDDYTRRTAIVLRALDAERTGRAPGGRRPSRSAGAGASGARAPRRTRRAWRTGAVVAVVAVFGALAAWAVTASSGSRLASQPITGVFAGKNAPGSATPTTAAAIDPRLSQAAQLVEKGKVTDALKLYDAVLKDRPDDPEALASEGWLIAQAGIAAQRTDLVDQGLVKIVAAEKVDPSYPTAHFFRGALLYQAKGDPAGAVTELRQYLGLVDPTSPEVPTVEQMLNEAMTAAGSKAGSPNSATPSVTSPPSTLAGPSSTPSP